MNWALLIQGVALGCGIVTISMMFACAWSIADRSWWYAKDYLLPPLGVVAGLTLIFILTLIPLSL